MRTKPDATDKHVGERVRMRRIKIGMSREKLGGALGITHHQVLKYENGKSVISVGRLHEIANILRVPVGFFFEGAPHGSNTTGELPSYVSEFLTTSEGLALTQALMKVSDAKKRRSVVKLVEKLADAEHKLLGKPGRRFKTPA